MTTVFLKPAKINRILVEDIYGGLYQLVNPDAIQSIYVVTLPPEIGGGLYFASPDIESAKFARGNVFNDKLVKSSQAAWEAMTGKETGPAAIARVSGMTAIQAVSIYEFEELSWELCKKES